jgi:uncharacterized protein (TIGR00725 family)
VTQELLAVPKPELLRLTLVGVIGSGECGDDAKKLAYDVGKGLAEAGCSVICGGLGGVMEAACHGAFDAGGLTIGVLPGDSARAANPFVRVPIVSGIGVARNTIIVRSSRVVVAVHGGPGTLSEIAFAMQFGVPVISLNSFDVSPDIIQVKTADEAVREAIALLDPRPASGD